ncbi:MAG: M20/M25/M40 family metallo-hydrolase [Lachnospiraceae bacterium]|nr:M20/M25/M40 family metallo-hydrolase [Lachnospiraceae bacterium]
MKEVADSKTIINKERLIKEFCELVSVDCESFHEEAMMKVLKGKLTELGIDVYEDEAGAHYGCGSGNVYGYLKGELEGAPLLFSSHMDTVSPGIGKQAVCHEDGTITSDGSTVLGSDDAAGIAAILEAVRSIREQHIPHRDLEFLFPMAEEAYVRGSSVFDYTKFKAKEAYVLDLSGAVGRASLREPTLISFQVKLTGRAAHAGFAPEEGIHTIAMAADAVCKIKQGRLDERTTLNIGKINGGTATNIVPQEVCLEGEIRSYDHERALEVLENVRETCDVVASAYGGRCDVTHEIHLKAYQVEESDPVVRRFLRVCEKLGFEGGLTETFGGSDNNSFWQHGIHGIVLSCAMNQVHTTQEYTTQEELSKSARIVAGLMTEREE